MSVLFRLFSATLHCSTLEHKVVMVPWFSLGIITTTAANMYTGVSQKIARFGSHMLIRQYSLSGSAHHRSVKNTVSYYAMLGKPIVKFLWKLSLRAIQSIRKASSFRGISCCYGHWATFRIMESDRTTGYSVFNMMFRVMKSRSTLRASAGRTSELQQHSHMCSEANNHARRARRQQATIRNGKQEYLALLLRLQRASQIGNDLSVHKRGANLEQNSALL